MDNIDFELGVRTYAILKYTQAEMKNWRKFVESWWVLFAT